MATEVGVGWGMQGPLMDGEGENEEKEHLECSKHKEASVGRVNRQ